VIDTLAFTIAKYLLWYTLMLKKYNKNTSEVLVHRAGI